MTSEERKETERRLSVFALRQISLDEAEEKARRARLNPGASAAERKSTRWAAFVAKAARDNAKRRLLDFCAFSKAEGTRHE